MSTCNNDTTATTNCPCDEFVHPAPLEIGAGQQELARQIAGFPEFRRAMLLAISEYGPLEGWAARKDEDLGVMLIEMWAYVCDVLAFYDGVIAHESYLRTARLRPSVRKLVDLLGYIPRPATAATVQVAALASGRQPITLPQGTVFRSKAFGTEPPQVFELDADTVIHPFANLFEILRPAYDTVGSSTPASLTVIPLSSLPAETLLLIVNKDDDAQTSFSKVAKEERFVGEDGVVYTQLSFESNTLLHSDTLLTDLLVYKPAQTARLSSLEVDSYTAYLDDFDGTESGIIVTYYEYLNLDRVYDQFKAGDYLGIQVGNAYYPAKIKTTYESDKVVSSGNTITINGSSFSIPDVTVPVTTIYLEYVESLHAVLDAVYDNSTVVIHHNMQLAANVVREPDVTVVAGDPLNFTKAVEEPIGSYSPSTFQLQDKNSLGVQLSGNFNGNKDGMVAGDTSSWTETFYSPVKVFANVISASRGESVSNEILGSGNASTASQQFKLKKGPLTYFPATASGSDAGVVNTLEIYVDNLLWTEVETFYLQWADAQVYIVRQNDDGDSLVTFGDGIRGSRLPSGTNNVIANYRFGAGAATPPAGAVNQIGKPVDGLQSIVNPVAATPGADAEEQEDMRGNAPQSILLLGRAISIKDMEAVALSVPGVTTAQAEWRWSETAQRPTVHIWYVGATGYAETIKAQLQNVTDGHTPFTVETATAAVIALNVSILYDSRYEPTALSAAITAVLTTETTGFLAPENLGIGQHFFRSQLYAAILSVPGTTGIQEIFWNGSTFSTYAKQQAAGKYWDFATTLPTITLTQDTTV